MSFYAMNVVMRVFLNPKIDGQHFSFMRKYLISIIPRSLLFFHSATYCNANVMLSISLGTYGDEPLKKESNERLRLQKSDFLSVVQPEI